MTLCMAAACQDMGQMRIVSWADTRTPAGREKHHSLRSRRLCVLCVFLGPIEHTQFSDLLSVPNQSNENAEDAETPRTQRLDLHFASFISLSACRQISRGALRFPLLHLD
jgi:hypothetical protein